MSLITLFFISIASFAANPSAAVSADTKERLEQAAQNLASIWGDTILEGDYYAEDLVQLDNIQMATDTNGMVYYRITYSSKAWDISTCRFNSRKLETLSTCQEGKIVEVGFVTLDFKKAAQDREYRAVFVPKKTSSRKIVN